MLKRLLLPFAIILTSLQTTFAADFKKPFTDLLGDSGVYGLLSNNFTVASLMFIAMLLGFNALVKVGLRFVFRNNTKERNVMSFAISFIGTSGIFYMYSKDGIDQLIVTFGGTIGFFLIAIVLFGGLKGLDALLVGEDGRRFRKPTWLLFMSLASFFVGTTLITFIENGSSIFDENSAIFAILNWVVSFGILGIITGLILFIVGFKAGKKVSDMQNTDGSVLNSLKKRRTAKKENNEFKKAQEQLADSITSIYTKLREEKAK